MGNARSAETVCEEDVWWSNADRYTQERTQTEFPEEVADADHETEESIISEREKRKKELEADFLVFKQELAEKHGRRRQLIAEKKKEMVDLRDELLKEKEESQRLRRLLEKNKLSQKSNCSNDTSKHQHEAGNVIIINLKEENEDLRNEMEKLKLILKEKEIITDKNKELRISLAEMQRELQSVNTQIISFEKERIDYQEHVTALKDIIRVTKEMLRVRENQIDELKKKISSIEELLASKEMSILSDDLRQEYERQLRNIRDLRSLYEERQRADRRDKENLQSQIDELKKSVEDEQTKNGEHTERIEELEADNSKKYDKIRSLESNFGLATAECKELHGEMDTINQLFSQILITFNKGQDIDLDHMTRILEENHDLLTNIVINDESGETSALPKVLLDLVNQVAENKKDPEDEVSSSSEQAPIQAQEKSDKLDTIQEVDEAQLLGIHQLNSPEEIVENLPKVWRVLIELLSQQCPPNNEITEKKGENDSHCYKSVETPTGLREVLSVSKTFIRLKNLILEKKSLEKEMTRLKQLNTHLEGRLSDQEKRLVLVSNELSKTWNFVGKMQKQHQQLHTQEKILRYELAQKRKLLTELKEELEYCRQKWQQARKQNSNTEEQWKQLRTEFASRKKCITDDINNSVESGYSDDKSSSDDDDPDVNGKGQEKQEVQSEKSSDLTEDSASVVDDSNLDDKNVVQAEKSTEKINDLVDDDKAETKNVDINETHGIEEVQNGPLDGVPGNNEESITKTESEKLSLDVQASALTNCSSNDLHSLEANETDDTKRQNDCDTSNSSTHQQLLTQTNEVKTSYESLLLTDSQHSKNTIVCNAQTTSSKPPDYTEKTEDALLDQCSASSTDNNACADIEKPSTSHKNPAEAAEEFVARREDRMKQLEEQCNQLFNSVAKTSLRGMVMSNKLDNLHEMYGDNTQTVSAGEASSTVQDDQTTEEETNPVADSTDNTKTQE